MVKNIVMIGVVVAALCGTVQAAVSEAGRSAVEAARSYGAAVRSCDLGWALDFMYPPLKYTYAEQFSSRNGREAENARRIMGLNAREKASEARARLDANVKQLREYYDSMGVQMRKSGVKIEMYKVHEPMAEYIVTPPGGVVGAAIRDSQAQVSAEQLQGEQERSRLVVLPITLIVAMVNPETGERVRVERRGHIYAIRDEVVSGGTDRRGLSSRDTKLNQWYFADGNTDTNLLRALFPNLPSYINQPDSSERVLR